MNFHSHVSAYCSWDLHFWSSSLKHSISLRETATRSQHSWVSCTWCSGLSNNAPRIKYVVFRKLQRQQYLLCCFNTNWFSRATSLPVITTLLPFIHGERYNKTNQEWGTSNKEGRIVFRKWIGRSGTARVRSNFMCTYWKINNWMSTSSSPFF